MKSCRANYLEALTKRHELNDVIPAKAGIQRRLVVHNESHWVPAFAGTTLVVILLGSLSRHHKAYKQKIDRMADRLTGA